MYIIITLWAILLLPIVNWKFVKKMINVYKYWKTWIHFYQGQIQGFFVSFSPFSRFLGSAEKNSYHNLTLAVTLVTCMQPIIIKLWWIKNRGLLVNESFGNRIKAIFDTLFESSFFVRLTQGSNDLLNYIIIYKKDNAYPDSGIKKNDMEEKKCVSKIIS